jgi:hypothetical protein
MDLEYRGGRSRADADWANHDAVIYGKGAPELIGEVWISREYDPDTGLPRRHRLYDHGFSRGYSERMAELLQSEGIPKWSMKSYLVPDNELVSMLGAKGFEKVEEFPCELNDNIVLMRRGTLKRWGSESTSLDDSLSIVTPETTVGTGSEDVAYVARFEKYPKLFFVRSRNKWVGAFHESGRLLSSASRQ